MKILYFGTVCEMSLYEEILMKCKTKPSVASVVFENAMLEGMKSNNADITIYSFPMIPTFPNGKQMCWGHRTQKLSSGYDCTWLRTINFPVLKQISRKLDARVTLEEWLKLNMDEEKVVLVYSIPPFMAKDIITVCRRYNTKCYAIVADLLKDMYINYQETVLKSWLQKIYIKPTLRIQGNFDGYIYLTEAMKDIINPNKPYIVMEGIADISNVEDNVYDSEVTAIMYAGGLYEKYGLINLIDAFESLKIPNLQLWLFGEGPAIKKIHEREQNNKNIIYMGCLERREILSYERMASVLVNPRSVDEEFTKYSFPSKIIEYMLSGTPVLTTKLPGIPDEYFSYVFKADQNDKETLANALKDILNLPISQRKIIAKAAQEFVVTNKSADSQAKRILNFICNQERE